MNNKKMIIEKFKIQSNYSKDEIDVRIESLKQYLDEIRVTLLQQIDCTESVLMQKLENDDDNFDGDVNIINLFFNYGQNILTENVGTIDFNLSGYLYNLKFGKYKKIILNEKNCIYCCSIGDSLIVVYSDSFNKKPQIIKYQNNNRCIDVTYKIRDNFTDDFIVNWSIQDMATNGTYVYILIHIYWKNIMDYEVDESFDIILADSDLNILNDTNRKSYDFKQPRKIKFFNNNLYMVDNTDIIIFNANTLEIKELIHFNGGIEDLQVMKNSIYIISLKNLSYCCYDLSSLSSEPLAHTTIVNCDDKFYLFNSDKNEIEALNLNGKTIEKFSLYSLFTDTIITKSFFKNNWEKNFKQTSARSFINITDRNFLIYIDEENTLLIL